MGLFQNLCHVYDLLAEHNVEELLPIGFIKQNVQIQCLLYEDDGKITLAESKVITDKKDIPTVLPVTEGSAGRTSKPAAHPLFDKLCYISKDYMNYCDESQFNQRQISERKTMFGLYRNELESFIASVEEDTEGKVDYDAKKVHTLLSVLYRYLMESDLIADLVKNRVLTLTDAKLKLAEGQKKTSLVKLLAKGEQGEAMVRFSVQLGQEERIDLWSAPDIWKAYLSYLGKGEGRKDVCAITGKCTKIAEKHPKYIRMPGDGAKLISSNDSSNYTYRGRFIDSSEPNAISYEASEKMHSALKYLINKQGFRVDDRVFLHFHSENDPAPDPNLQGLTEKLVRADSFQKIGAKEVEDYTNELASKKIHKAMRGEKEYSVSDNITTLVLDAATPGRLSVLYYSELPNNLYFERIKNWYERSFWENQFFMPNEEPGSGKKSTGIGDKGKYATLLRAPTIWNIVEVALGEHPDTKQKANQKLKKEMYQRILISLIQGQRIPRDIMMMCVRSASSCMTARGECRREIGVACSMYKNYSWEKENYTMELDETRKNRSYLYGRLLAVADKVERDAMYIRGRNHPDEQRSTNAARYTNAFSTKPHRMWGVILKAIDPYLLQLDQKWPKRAKEHRDEMTRIHMLFEENDYMSNKSLEGSYLIGYHCQRAKLWGKSTDSDLRDAEE